MKLDMRLGDCLDVLPTLEPVDLVLTDPPWGISGSSGTINELRGKGNYSGSFDDSPEYVVEVVTEVIRSLVSRTQCVVVTPGCKNMMSYPQPNSFGCFYQPKRWQKK